MKKIRVLEIYLTVGLFATVGALLYVWLASPFGTSDRVGITMAISTVALVIVTSIYAWHTRKMAEEMREQRYAQSLPLLIPHFPPDVDTVAPSGSLYQFLRYGGINVLWHNVGKGVAINSTFSLWGATLPSGEVHRFLALESLALGSGQQIATSFEVYSIQRDKPERYQPRLEAEYQDIYERKITTVQEFRIEEENDNKRAFLGGLYFTVNGRRFGEEVIQHD